MSTREQSQIALCLKYGADFVPPSADMLVGVADNIGDLGLLPINGLRHPQEGQTCGWYIWKGETLSQADDFFKPMKLEELVRRLPEVERYLALPPSWRFLFAPGSEDVWNDPELLQV